MDKIPLSGLITPIFETDKYPVIDPRFGIDGLRSLESTSDMHNIPLEKRRAGMVVGIPDYGNNTVAYYKLKPQGNGITWSIGDSNNWDGFLTSVTASNAIPVKYNITNEVVTVPQNYEYLVWGDVAIGNSGSFVNNGKTYVINGTFSISGDGQKSAGNYYYIQVPTKFTTTFSCSQSGTTITHNLNTKNIVYSVRDGDNFVSVNVETVTTNSIKVTSQTLFNNGTITIIG